MVEEATSIVISTQLNQQKRAKFLNWASTNHDKLQGLLPNINPMNACILGSSFTEANRKISTSLFEYLIMNATCEEQK